MPGDLKVLNTSSTLVVSENGTDSTTLSNKVFEYQPASVSGNGGVYQRINESLNAINITSQSPEEGIAGSSLSTSRPRQTEKMSTVIETELSIYQLNNSMANLVTTEKPIVPNMTQVTSTDVEGEFFSNPPEIFLSSSMEPTSRGSQFQLNVTLDNSATFNETITVGTFQTTSTTDASKSNVSTMVTSTVEMDSFERNWTEMSNFTKTTINSIREWTNVGQQISQNDSNLEFPHRVNASVYESSMALERKSTTHKSDFETKQATPSSVPTIEISEGTTKVSRYTESPVQSTSQKAYDSEVISSRNQSFVAFNVSLSPAGLPLDIDFSTGQTTKKEITVPSIELPTATSQMSTNKPSFPNFTENTTGNWKWESPLLEPPTPGPLSSLTQNHLNQTFHNGTMSTSTGYESPQNRNQSTIDVGHQELTKDEGPETTGIGLSATSMTILGGIETKPGYYTSNKYSNLPFDKATTNLLVSVSSTQKTPYSSHFSTTTRGQVKDDSLTRKNPLPYLVLGWNQHLSLETTTTTTTKPLQMPHTPTQLLTNFNVGTTLEPYPTLRNFDKNNVSFADSQKSSTYNYASTTNFSFLNYPNGVKPWDQRSTKIWTVSFQGPRYQKTTSYQQQNMYPGSTGQDQTRSTETTTKPQRSTSMTTPGLESLRTSPSPTRWRQQLDETTTKSATTIETWKSEEISTAQGGILNWMDGRPKNMFETTTSHSTTRKGPGKTSTNWNQGQRSTHFYGVNTQTENAVPLTNDQSFNQGVTTIPWWLIPKTVSSPTSTPTYRWLPWWQSQKPSTLIPSTVSSPQYEKTTSYQQQYLYPGMTGQDKIRPVETTSKPVRIDSSTKTQQGQLGQPFPTSGNKKDFGSYATSTRSIDRPTSRPWYTDSIRKSSDEVPSPFSTDRKKDKFVGSTTQLPGYPIHGGTTSWWEINYFGLTTASSSSTPERWWWLYPTGTKGPDRRGTESTDDKQRSSRPSPTRWWQQYDETKKPPTTNDVWKSGETSTSSSQTNFPRWIDDRPIILYEPTTSQTIVNEPSKTTDQSNNWYQTEAVKYGPKLPDTDSEWSSIKQKDSTPPLSTTTTSTEKEIIFHQSKSTAKQQPTTEIPGTTVNQGHYKTNGEQLQFTPSQSNIRTERPNYFTNTRRPPATTAPWVWLIWPDDEPQPFTTPRVNHDDFRSTHAGTTTLTTPAASKWATERASDGSVIFWRPGFDNYEWIYEALGDSSSKTTTTPVPSISDQKVLTERTTTSTKAPTKPNVSTAELSTRSNTPAKNYEFLLTRRPFKPPYIYVRRTTTSTTPTRNPTTLKSTLSPSYGRETKPAYVWDNNKAKSLPPWWAMPFVHYNVSTPAPATLPYGWREDFKHSTPNWRDIEGMSWVVDVDATHESKQDSGEQWIFATQPSTHWLESNQSSNWMVFHSDCTGNNELLEMGRCCLCKIDLCKRLCDSNRECSGFTYSQQQGGLCIFQSIVFYCHVPFQFLFFVCFC